MRATRLARLLFGWGCAALVPPAGHGAEPTAVYPMRGVLKSFDLKTGQATVSHEEIRGYMPAMTMSFDLADPAEMRDVQPGDTFSCQLEVGRERAWIERVHKEGSSGGVPVGPLTAGRATELKPGDSLPDIELTDARGETARLHDFAGKALAISFIYLRCPLPTYCPLTNHNFQAAQALLERLGIRAQTHFLSVSLDPANDTPAQLADFAQAQEADPRVWTFATAREDALHKLGDAVGLEFQRNGSGINHNLRTVVVDARGRLRRVFRGNTWTPQELAAELRATILAP